MKQLKNSIKDFEFLKSFIVSAQQTDERKNKAANILDITFGMGYHTGYYKAKRSSFVKGVILGSLGVVGIQLLLKLNEKKES